MKSEKEVEQIAMEHGLNAEETCNVCGEELLWEHKAKSFARGYKQAQKDMIEEIEKLKKHNEEYAGLIDHIGNLVEEKVERVDFFCLGDNVHSVYFENKPIFEMARQALKNIKEIK
jgi:DNA repair exonuclease SbcCD ATPase subunit